MSKAALGFLAGLGLLAVAGGVWYVMELGTTSAANDGRVPEQVEKKEVKREPEPVRSPGASIGDENLVEFRCDGQKTFTAVFARDIVGLTLDDGRQLELRQVVSGSGIRYANPNGTIEFHGKGEGGFLQEGAMTTYANCVAMI